MSGVCGREALNGIPLNMTTLAIGAQRDWRSETQPPVMGLQTRRAQCAQSLATLVSARTTRASNTECNWTVASGQLHSHTNDHSRPAKATATNGHTLPPGCIPSLGPTRKCETTADARTAEHRAKSNPAVWTAQNRVNRCR